MAKLLASNKFENFNLLHQIQVDSGFSRFNIDSCGEMNICVYKKLNFDNDNYLKTDNGFIACCGTLLYKGGIGAEALAALYYDFSQNGIKARKKCSGFYSVCICINGDAHFFTDNNGECSLYYYYKDNDFIASTQYYYILKAKKCDVNQFAFEERCIHYCNVDNETPFKNIYRLRGSEELVYTNDGTIKVETIPANPYSDYSHVATYQTIAESLKENATALASCFSKTSLFSTGGFDSRLALAAMLSAGMKPTLLSWVGNLYSASADPNDRLVSEQLATKYNLDIKHIQFSDEIDKIEDGQLCNYVKKYGELSKVYSSNSAFFQALSDVGNSYITAGYFGEIYRTNGQLDKVFHEPFDIASYVNEFYLDQGMEKAFSSELKLKGYLTDIMSDCANCIGLASTEMSREDCMILHYYYRLHADTCVCQLANLFTYSTNILASKNAVDEVLKVSYLEKESVRLQMMCSKELQDDIFDVPMYSHQAFYKVNAEAFTANRIDPKSTLIKNRIRKILGDKLYTDLKRLMRKDRVPADSLIMKELIYYEKCIETFESKIGFKLDYDKSVLFPFGRFEIANNYYYLLAYLLY